MEWISVEEKLPEDGEGVIACGVVPNRPNNIVVSGAMYDFSQWWHRDGQIWEDVFDRRVTHWMPLPAPPEAAK